MSIYNFKNVTVVPSANDFIDISLSKIQRKTPTVVHARYEISRIRQFYMRKVKFAQDCFTERLEGMLNEFPKMNEIHPFYADLLNILYDKDHYKLALGQISTAKHLIDNVAKDYVKFLKFGDSLYRCKLLKKAALGRMATIIKRQKNSLAYLEQVRQHLARLPSIDPNTRTLILCGYPNVGKSSFMNKVTKADVEVQPWAFTTKSLFVGHMDYKYLRWQCIDTPGILTHPLEERNTIEMQSITALAHLRACVMFFIDLSEQCGYSIAEQCELYHSIKPLFGGKPTLLVVNKVDVCSPEDIDEEQKALVDSILAEEGVEMVRMSCLTDDKVFDVRNYACEKLLAARVETKLMGSKIHNVLNKLRVAMPDQRDDVDRKPFVPENFKNKVKEDNRPLAKDVERENGGAGVYNVNLRQDYILKNDEWKQDRIPEIMDGKNIADFVDPEIADKLDALEREEEKLIESGFYDEEAEIISDDEALLRDAVKQVKSKKAIIIQQHRENRGRSILPRSSTSKHESVDKFVDHLNSLHMERQAENVKQRALSRGRSLVRKRGRSTDSMDVDEDIAAFKSVKKSDLDTKAKKKRSISRVSRDRSVMGLRDDKQVETSDRMKKISQRAPNREAKAGEGDRHIMTRMPKHLFSGKRKSGKTDRR